MQNNFNQNFDMSNLYKLWETDLQQPLENLEKNIKNTLYTELSNLIVKISNYDKYLGEHSALVTKGAVILAKELGFAGHAIEKIAVASLLHDIGYICIPKHIFDKAEKLSQNDWTAIKLHPIIACEHILKDISIFQDYLPIILHHHEFIDGSGYPYGKKGDEIPIESQIISIIDSYQAMKVDRPYRKALPFETIIDIYIRNAGIKWDKDLITIFTTLIADTEMQEEMNLERNKKFNISSYLDI